MEKKRENEKEKKTTTKKQEENTRAILPTDTFRVCLSLRVTQQPDIWKKVEGKCLGTENIAPWDLIIPITDHRQNKTDKKTRLKLLPGRANMTKRLASKLFPGRVNMTKGLALKLLPGRANMTKRLALKRSKRTVCKVSANRGYNHSQRFSSVRSLSKAMEANPCTSQVSRT